MLRVWVYSYFAIGVCFAQILWVSFMIPHLWPPSWTAFAVQPVAVMSAGVRLVLWGPSLVAWYADSNGYPFGMWLAPGLYAELENA